MYRRILKKILVHNIKIYNITHMHKSVLQVFHWFHLLKTYKDQLVMTLTHDVSLPQVQFSDTDEYGHASWASYVRWAIDGLHAALLPGALNQSVSILFCTFFFQTEGVGGGGGGGGGEGCLGVSILGSASFTYML